MSTFISDVLGEFVTFKLYSTKYPGAKSLSEWSEADDANEDIIYDDETNTAQLINGTIFDPSLKTIVTAHGNTGKLKLDMFMWKHYCQAAMDKGQEHYNIIGIILTSHRASLGTTLRPSSPPGGLLCIN